MIEARHPLGTFTSVKTFLFKPNREMLILRRSSKDSDHPGTYDLPGGGVDREEDFYDAAIREIYQETGLKLGRSALFLVYTKTSPHERYLDNAVRLFCIGLVDADQQPRLSDEHDLYLWAPVDQARNLLTHPPHVEALSYLASVGVLNTMDAIAEYPRAS